jgi:hypothetical protein
MLKILKNTTASDILITDTGVNIAAFGQHEIQRMDYWLWTDSRDAVTQLINGNLVMNDGEYNLTNLRVAIGLLQDNKIVINEHYSLVEEDDVLIGNGQILYLNDEFDTTNNVPDYIDEQIEDDDPTGGGAS